MITWFLQPYTAAQGRREEGKTRNSTRVAVLLPDDNGKILIPNGEIKVGFLAGEDLGLCRL
jgi:hypothetical protein